jgi:hypothetical protein
MQRVGQCVRTFGGGGGGGYACHEGMKKSNKVTKTNVKVRKKNCRFEILFKYENPFLGKEKIDFFENHTFRTLGFDCFSLIVVPV